MPDPVATPDFAQYRRQARRIRHRYAGDPLRTQLALHRLSKSTPAGTQRPARPQAVRRTDSLAQALGSSAAPDEVARLADEIRNRLDGPIMRGSVRSEIVILAGRIGLNRFEANLLIALVQHRAQPPESIDAGFLDLESVGDAEVTAETTRGPGRAWIPLLVAIAVQLLIVLAASAMFGVRG